MMNVIEARITPREAESTTPNMFSHSVSDNVDLYRKI